MTGEGRGELAKMIQGGNAQTVSSRERSRLTLSKVPSSPAINLFPKEISFGDEQVRQKNKIFFDYSGWKLVIGGVNCILVVHQRAPLLNKLFWELGNPDEIQQ